MKTKTELPIAKSGSVDSNIVREILLGQLQESCNNPRRTMNDADLAELAASIREHGINVPLLVRPVADADTGTFSFYEVVCGHRRSYAANVAGLDSVPCIVRELTDEQAAELALIDNLQRVDVPAIEEAEAFNQLLPRLGSIAAVAAKVGKEQAYVAKRLRLCALTCWSADALRAKLITIDHALLLARLAENEQNAALKWCLNRNAGSKTPVQEVLKERLEQHEPDEDEEDESDRRPRWRHTWEPETVLRLKEHIECESGIPLDRAPWDLDQDGLAEDASPCSSCEKNTKANTPLFGDLDTGVAICTDGACFKEKTASFVRIQARLSEGVQAPLRVSWKSTSTAPRFEKVDTCKCAGGKNCKTGEGCRGVVKPEQIFKYGQWIDVGPKSKKCEHTRPAVAVDWSDAGQRGFMGGDEKLRKPGEVIQVCVASECKVHKKAYGAAAGKTAGSTGPNVSPAQTKLDRKCAAAREKEEKAIRAKVFHGVLAKLDVGTALRMAAGNIWNAPAARKEIFTAFPRISGDLLEALVLFNHQFSRVAEIDSYWLEEKGVAVDRKKLWDLAKLVGVDANAIAARHFHDAGSIAPACDSLYPKGVKWPKDVKPDVEKLSVKKPAKKKPAKKAAKKKGGRK